MLGKCPTTAPDITPLMGELCYTLTPEIYPQTRTRIGARNTHMKIINQTTVLNESLIATDFISTAKVAQVKEYGT